MDHLSDVISDAFHDSEIAKRFSCKRTNRPQWLTMSLENHLRDPCLKIYEAVQIKLCSQL
ncbi:unnamed protein product [Callosobruchus maculatus]|uniref:Uncharacterized protein n=1 Tax=Callosobruchus maculatus TaxID=64391 RepID=A0A653BLI5_CALMS|nr:unnamed protein product [Callosobruchus maculatus]